MGKRGMSREGLWSDAEVELLQSLYGKSPESKKDAVRELGRSYRAVTRKAWELGLTFHETPRVWTATEDAYLRENFECSRTVDIARQLGRNRTVVAGRAAKLGLTNLRIRARDSVVHNYFTDMERPVQAYILGLLASDGAVSGNRNEISIALHPKDACLVEFIRDEIAPSASLRLETQSDGRRRIQLRIYSSQMKTDLAALEVTPRKSLTLQWPQKLPCALDNNFLLGCFDGDGSLSYREAKALFRWSLVSASSLFLEEVKRKLGAATGANILGPYRNGGRTFSIEAIGKSAYSVDEWLHLEMPGLARKRPDGRDAVERHARLEVRKRGKTHCVHGHEMTAGNTYTDSKGHRSCKTCRRIVHQRGG